MLRRLGKLSGGVFSAATVVLAAGCGEYGEPVIGGGATVVPQVVFIASEADAAGADAAAGSDASAEVATGSIRGRVQLTGTAPTMELLVKQGADIKDKEVCAAVDVPNERLQVSGDGGVANVFVYLQKAPKGGRPVVTPAEPFVFDQKNCRFYPHTVVLPVNQTVRVLSNDSVAHNTHTYPSKNNSVNSGVAPMDRDGKLEIVYRKAEAVPLAVKCDYHAWMNAWHLPLDHPYGAVTNENGEFAISDLPVGTHSFVVWHEAADGNFVQRKLAVEVKAGEETEVKVEYPSSMLKL
ncbi:MAG: carboxypeptidase regulatory-like domain-containing protein [Planctomycetaceae bacterium]